MSMSRCVTTTFWLYNPSTDIDECETGEARCRGNEACVNLPGSYECRQVCPRGYRFAGELSNGVPNCIDIDECSANESLCPSEATCINEPGSFRCQCPDGQPPAGNSCLGTLLFRLSLVNSMSIEWCILVRSSFFLSCSGILLSTCLIQAQPYLI